MPRTIRDRLRRNAPPFQYRHTAASHQQLSSAQLQGTHRLAVLALRLIPEDLHTLVNQGRGPVKRCSVGTRY